MSIIQEAATTLKTAVAEKVPAAKLLDPLMEWLQRSDIGGLQGLVKKFEDAGLKTQIQSWIGGGKQLPATPADITRVIGDTDLGNLATKSGMSADDVSKHLSELLPNVVKNLTPEGKLPEVSKLAELGGSLKKTLGIGA